ncbi:TadE family protein [Faunimonas sp. B44]|uniref:TadE family protein n=1 Tax=Faunimonas sp. B44 TaxID=3461493 RepID=UPI004044F7B3
MEFALLAPILFFGLLATVDLGLALHERMSIDHALRAGAQSAMTDPGPAAVRRIVEETAGRNFTVASGTTDGTTFLAGQSPLAVEVERFCACPSSPDAAVGCGTACAGGQPTYVFYRLTGEKPYEGMLIPDLGLSAAVQVQTR